MKLFILYYIFSSNLKLLLLLCSFSLGLMFLHALHFIISFPVQIDLRKSRPVIQYKNFQIEESAEGFHLYGTDTFRPTLAELLEYLESQNLRTDNLLLQLLRCCPPQPRGKLRSATAIENSCVMYFKVFADRLHLHFVFLFN